MAIGRVNRYIDGNPAFCLRAVDGMARAAARGRQGNRFRIGATSELDLAGQSSRADGAVSRILPCLKNSTVLRDRTSISFRVQMRMDGRVRSVELDFE
jgi:hypothetical protein